MAFNPGLEHLNIECRRHKRPYFVVSASRSPPGLGSDTASRSPPGRGHRFAQSAVPWKHVVFHSFCATLLHLYVNSGPFLTQFFVLWGHFWRTWGTLLPFKMKKGHLGTPIVIFPDITSTFGTHFGVSFGTFSEKTWVLQVLFSVLFHSHVFSWFLVRFMVSGTLKIHKNQWRVVQNQGSRKNVKIASEVASRVNFDAILKPCWLPKCIFFEKRSS